ncbi:LamG domain-containing protein [bacterium]|nr:LamG domain-containing protein [bacterium]
MRTLVVFGIAAFTLMLMSFVTFAADFKEGLVLYLPFDEGKGDVAGDISGNSHDGKIDSPEWVDGKFGKALKFNGDGSGTFVTVESTDMLNVNEMTFMAWINADHWNGTRQIVGKSVHGGCGGRTQYGLFSEGGAFILRFETEAGRVDINIPPPPTGEWVHVAFTNDGKEAKIFINGTEEGKGAIAGKLNANADPWRIGQDCDRANYIFAGLIDDVRLWNHALSEKEIGDYMKRGVDVFPVEPQNRLSTSWGKIKTNIKN